MNLDRELLKVLLRLGRPLILSLILSLFSSAAIVAQARFLSHIIDRVFLGGAALSIVMPTLLLYLASAVLRATTFWGGRSAAAHIAARVKNDIRSKLTTHLWQLGPGYVNTEQTGELKNTITAGVDALDAYISDYLPQLVLAALIPLLILLFVFPVDVLSGFVFLVTAPLIPLFMILIGDVAQTLTKKQWTVLSRMNAFFLDVLQGLTMLKILGRSREYAEKIRQVTQEFRHTTIKVLRVAFLSALVLELLATISTALIAVEIGLRLLYSRMSFEQALFILILAPEFYQPLRQLGARFHAGMEGFTAAKRIFEILSAKPGISFGSKKTPVNITSIHFQSVYYSYPHSEKEALADIDLYIEQGQKVAIVGPSGAGKSTLISLLLRFIDPTSGRLCVNGQTLQEFDINFWRRALSWLPQRPFIFHDTVLENVRLAKENADTAEIERALERAQAKEFVDDLPNGLDTLIGERGARLSGGQAQRIALARAFLKDAPLFVFDEATAHLDAKTEARIQTSLDILAADRTVIAIAHRLYTVQTADVIFVLNNGTLVGSGRHDELLLHNGVYRRLVEAQEIQP